MDLTTEHTILNVKIYSIRFVSLDLNLKVAVSFEISSDNL